MPLRFVTSQLFFLISCFLSGSVFLIALNKSSRHPLTVSSNSIESTKVSQGNKKVLSTIEENIYLILEKKSSISIVLGITEFPS